ncbi:MAG: PAS domain-containing protein [Planctomycetes bacterium]|nr:PAS domain-containing protein [Planctomycetota bacterium]
MKTKDLSEIESNGRVFETKTRKAAQRVSWRTVAKRAFVIFLPLALLLGGVLGVFYSTNVKAERRITEAAESQLAELQRQTVARNFHSIVSDVMILSQQNELEEVFDGHQEAKDDLSNEFLAFSKTKRSYDQLRYLDETGMEIVRINFNEGKPGRVPEEKLQSKGKRYYFTDAFALDIGEIFVSSLDLNIVECSVIERPLKENFHPGEATFDSIWREAKGGKYAKPMIRFATPIFNSEGQKKGIVLANCFGAQLINIFNEIGQNSLGQCFLVNREGFWLKGPSGEVEWGFMQGHDKEQTVANTFPDAWRRISKEESGQFYTANGLFTFTTVYPLFEGLKTSSGSGEAFEASAKRLAAGDYYWKIVTQIQPGVLYAQRNVMACWLLMTWGLLTIIIGVSSWFLVRNKVIKKQGEEELKSLNRKIEFILGASKTGIDIIDSKFNIRYIDSARQKIYGDPTGRKCYEFFMGLDHVCPGCGAVQALETKEVIVTEEVLPRENNRPIQVTSMPFQNDEGEWLVAEVSTDITERKKAEEQIENLARFPSENPNPILRISQDGTVLYANSSSQSLLDEWGCGINELVPDFWLQVVSDVLGSNSKKNIDCKHEGRIISFEVAPISSASYVNFYGRDVTWRRENEEKLKKTLAELERFNKLMTGREKRVIEMKKEVNDLLAELSRPPQYSSVLESEKTSPSPESR